MLLIIGALIITLILEGLIIPRIRVKLGPNCKYLRLLIWLVLVISLGIKTQGRGPWLLLALAASLAGPISAAKFFKQKMSPAFLQDPKLQLIDR